MRSTEVITLGSGSEQRNTRWANSRRRYNVGYGVKTLNDLHRILAFFEERRGRLFGFRFRDPMDFSSSTPGSEISPNDQELGSGDGERTRFKLTKTYGKDEFAYVRTISRPLPDTLEIAINGTALGRSEFQFDAEAGEVEITGTTVPGDGDRITAGFEFDVPVRFDTDEILVNLNHFDAGDIPSIPLVELLP